jgi:hypothetical protein
MNMLEGFIWVCQAVAPALADGNTCATRRSGAAPVHRQLLLPQPALACKLCWPAPRHTALCADCRVEG